MMFHHFICNYVIQLHVELLKSALKSLIISDIAFRKYVVRKQSVLTLFATVKFHMNQKSGLKLAEQRKILGVNITNF